MCGIIGVFGALPDQKLFTRARDLMVHRGPDDAGVFYSPDQGIALGQRRLSVIDLSVAGKQPLVSRDGRFTLVFNGEIYNYQEIRRELGGVYQFETKTDTEALLVSYIRWGEKCLEKLNGMFVFAVWDREKKELFIARDRLGVKPLYFATKDDTFYFASEIKSILACSNFERRLNKQALLDYLSYRYVLGDGTMFENIFSVLPGHYINIDSSGEVVQKKYWDLPVVDEKNDLSEEEVLKKTEELIKKSLKYRMISDVPLGAYLSGGLDSSLLVSMMSRMSNKKVKTFSISFAEDGFDESVFARQVADYCDTEHYEFILGADDYISLLPEVIRYKDSPLGIPNEVAVHVLSKELKKHITVVLSGEGADELFGGYGRIFRSGYDFERMQDASNLTGFEKEELAKNLQQKYCSQEFESITEHFLGQYTYFPFDEKMSLLNPEIFEQGDEYISNKKYFQDFFLKIKKLSPSEQYMYIFQKIHLLGPLYRLDTSTMSGSVEARVPFVDHELVEYVSSLPLKFKMKWKTAEDRQDARVLNSDQISEVKDTTKYILRKIAEKYIPRKILERKKMGFPVPLNVWFEKKENRERVVALILSPNAKSRDLYDPTVLKSWLVEEAVTGRRGYNLWMMMNLEIWMNEYNVII